MSIGCLMRCGRIGRKRGLCSSCYERIRKCVAAGNTSWQDMEDQGLAAPPGPSSFRREMGGYHHALIRPRRRGT